MSAQFEPTRFNLIPTGAALGADVEGLDLSGPLDKTTVVELERAWMEHQVLRFRGQKLDEDRLTAFSRLFGLLDKAPVRAASVREYANPYVLLVSNIVENGQAIGSLGNYESQWHIYMSYLEAPPIGSVLYAVEIPPRGGETGFGNLHAAYDALPEDLRQTVEERLCTHDASYNSAGELRQGFAPVIDPREAPGAAHPLVRRHPVTGRKALFLGRRRNAYLHGLSLADSEQILDRLWEHAIRPEFTWYQQWRVGDAVMWDNRCTIHRRESFDAESRRLMLRTQIGALQAAEAAA
ncbi:MAG: TauD/TfdA dioxygenase family protein [Geminicoccaceae bacterium]